MRTLLLKFILLPLIFLGMTNIQAQPIQTTAGSVTSCPIEIQVPVNVTNCNGVGAISLVLEYNSAVLTFLGYQNLNAALSSGLLIVNATGGRVIISWANTTAANIGNGTLMQLRFNTVPGNSTLNWDVNTPGNCEFSSTSGVVLSSTFVNGTASIQQPPQINTQPQDVTTLVGQNTGFGLSASGTGLAYLWQLSTNGGSSWSDLANNSTYSGVTTANLGITNALLTYNGYKYRCRITGTCTPVVYSNEVTLTVINPVTTTLPTTSSCPGNIVVPVTVTNFTGIAAFSLTISYNSAVLTYTGHQALNASLAGGVFVANAIADKIYLTWYSTTAATFGNGTIVELKFTASPGSSTLNWDQSLPGNCEYTSLSGSQIVSVFVNGNQSVYTLPAIVNHPVKSTIAKGQNTSFSTTASGSGLTYLWQVSTNGGSSYTDLTNTGVYTGVTTSTMSITNAPLSMSGYLYRCKVSGTCPPFVYTNSALLTVLPNIITNCQTVTSCPGIITVPVNVTDFINVGAFSLALKFNPAILTYHSYQNANVALSGGSMVVNASNGTVYFTWSSTSPATIAGGSTLIELRFTGIPGSSTLQWDTQTAGNCEYSDPSGLIIYSTWNNGNVTVYSPPAITANPIPATIYAGGSTSFSVTATGTGLAYAWQVSTNGGSSWSNLTNTSPYSGTATSTLNINPAAIGMNGYLYRCNVSGTCTPSVASGSALLQVTVAAITTTAGSVTSSCSGSLSIPVTVTNCNNVGAISLVLNFDPAKLSYYGYQSLNSALSSGVFVLNVTSNKVILTWASTTPANIGNGTLIQILFRASAGISTSLTWDNLSPGNCEYSDGAGTIITSFYQNATISTAANALVANAGNDVSLFLGNNVQLNGTATGGATPYTYLWTPSTGLNNPALPNPTASPVTSTEYTITVTGSNSCVAYDKVKVTVVKPLNLQFLLEGLYSGSGTMHEAYDEFGPHFGNGIADQVIIELHAAANYSSLVYSSAPQNLSTAGLLQAGIPVEFNGSYYVTIQHRNSLEITSASPISFSGSSVNYQFDLPSKVFGDNLLYLPDGYYVIYGGDVNKDDIVDSGDMIPVDNLSSAFTSGYLPEDVNGDGLVDSGDMILVDNNSSMFIGSILP